MRRQNLLASAACAVVAAVAAVSASAQTPNTRAVHPLWGDIDAFWGDIDAFWGDIDAFEGTANPFWGDIDAFWGDIDAFQGAANPFWGDIDAFWGNIDAFGGLATPQWGDIDAFWGDIDAFQGSVSGLWGNIDAFWGDIDAFGGNVAAYDGLRSNLDLLISRSRSFWGPAVEAQTGLTFDQAFVTPLLAKHGIRLDDPASFSGFNGIDRTRFFFDWYDGLMSYSGRDHVDWWMPMVGWTPKLTQQVGAGTSTTIGLVDFTLKDGDLRDNLNPYVWGGYNNPMSGHGNAVASLLVGAHDGRGVMGIDPSAVVAANNPFDSTGTAGWDDIANSLNVLNLSGARVINLSLGVPGYTLAPEWRDLYSRWLVRTLAPSTVFVHAAGNDGLAQAQDIAWNFSADPNMIIVGSVGPSGEISSFSNTPGVACLLDNGACREPLRNRFMVAPGEWILVSDGQGGVTRRSGTSFAAPLVTGAIALAQDRWGWLKQNPDETVDLLFRTATDLGAPGIDNVYGHGLLNIAATQRPIDWTRLYQRVVDRKGDTQNVAVNAVPVSGPLTDTSISYITVYEDIGDTFRDFRLPVSAILAPVDSKTSKTQTTLQSMTTASTTTTTTSTTSSRSAKALSLANPWGWELTARSFALPATDASAQLGLTQASELAVVSRSGVELRFGNGVGAMSLSGDAAASQTRFDRTFGGANPVLGLASGGGFARIEAPVPGGARLAIGATGRAHRESYADPASGEVRKVNPNVATYRSRAAHVSLTQPVGEQLTLTGGYTLLRESDAVLGVQSTHPQAFASGSLTDAATLAADWSVSDQLSFSVTGTVGATRAQAAGAQALAVGKHGIRTTALEAALKAKQVFLPGDSARIALVQPMHVELGGYTVSEVAVADRSTGELGVTTRYISANDSARELALEVSYGASFLDGRAEAGAFLRAEGALARGTREDVDHMVGGQLKFRF